jgi:hypothetical protein
MPVNDITKNELLELYLRRQGKEKSRAMPREHYRDPQTNVEFPAEVARRNKKLKRKGRHG